ncbi:MAG TPA: hypothetical protein VHM89_01905 [Acidimicrobiales bacterium]|nr:hypothetical protein [Acidimicrobiales bacterium]
MTQVRQAVFTVIAPISDNGLAGVHEAVARIRDDPGGNPLVPFARFETIHFASIVVAEGLDPSLLILEINADGTARACLAALVAGAGPGLDALFGSSAGYPGSGDEKAARAWLGERIVRPGAYHIGATGRTLRRIRDETRLHDAIEGFLDAEEVAGRLAGVAPGDIRARIQDFVRADPSLAWARTSPPRQTPGERAMHWARFVGVVAAAVLLLPVLVPLVAAAAVVLRIKEHTDKVQEGPPDPDHVRRLQDEEDVAAQNHLASVIPLKPGPLRMIVLRVVLLVVNLVARVLAVNGRLGDIPSIHFAHWSMINGNRHLLFVSNFDGSWESYLGDFIDKAATGLTAVWSNTVEFPRTRFLAFEGAADGPRFREWARARQCSTDAWYTAYPAATMATIDNNTSIREGLFTALDEKGTAEWLVRL